ncbi:MAG: MFS transporter [Gemmatimonadales bacterium]|nr:MFS transporter [Gemmatimonadales bacterium]
MPTRTPSVFSALRHRDFRLFLGGQLVSQCGTWVQVVAQGWLVLQLTDSAFAVGLVTALGSLPILLFTLYGGVLADRVDKRRLVLVLQALMMVEALTLAVLTHQGWITVHLVMGLAAFYGLLSAFEVPTRQALVSEIVGRDDLMNAIALNSSAFNVARVVGPSIAGALIATVGLAACFYLNAASYLAVLVGLVLMRVERPATPSKVRAFGALKEGFGYIFGNPWPRALVTIIASFSIFGYSFVPLMPVFARDVLGLDADGYGALVSAIGLGAAVGAIGMAAGGGRTRSGRLLIGTFALFGLLLAAGAFAPDFWSALTLFTAAGCLMAVNGIQANTMLQLQAPDRLRGRVMGFYSFVVLGMAPIGAFQAGWVSEHFGVRTAYALGGAACVLMAGAVGWAMKRVMVAR